MQHQPMLLNNKIRCQKKRLTNRKSRKRKMKMVMVMVMEMGMGMVALVM